MRYSDLIGEYQNKQTLINLKSRLADAGYKSIGKGIDAIVFAKKDSPDVIKVLIGDHDRETNVAAAGFLAFAEFCKTVKSPHLPKFGKITKLKFDTEEVYQVSVERLYKLSEDEADVAFSMARFAEFGNSFEDVIKDIKETGSGVHPKFRKEVELQQSKQIKIAQKNQSIFPIMQTLHKHVSSLKGMSLDLVNEVSHNIMKRRDGTWMISDPFAA
jgi:hypothetical protein